MHGAGNKVNDMIYMHVGREDCNTNNPGFQQIICKKKKRKEEIPRGYRCISPSPYIHTFSLSFYLSTGT